MLIVMMNITFNLNVAARFFIVIYAHDFVKNSQLDLKLFRQIYWLAWMVDLGGKKVRTKESKSQFYEKSTIFIQKMVNLAKSIPKMTFFKL